MERKILKTAVPHFEKLSILLHIFLLPCDPTGLLIAECGPGVRKSSSSRICRIVVHLALLLAFKSLDIARYIILCDIQALLERSSSLKHLSKIGSQ